MMKYPAISILFSVWVTLTNHYWVTSDERRRALIGACGSHLKNIVYRMAQRDSILAAFDGVFQKPSLIATVVAKQQKSAVSTLLSAEFRDKSIPQILALLWIASIFSRASATSGRFGKNVMKSRYSASACLNVPSAYQASAIESFARGT